MKHIERPTGFMAATEDYAAARAVLFGIPMDFTTSFRPGTRFGPRRIREVSAGLEEYSFAAGEDLLQHPFYDLGDVATVMGNVPLSLERAHAVAAEVAGGGKCPLMLGGEHLVTLPVVQAVAARHPDLCVVQFDAHADLREEYLGERLSHATVMRRVSEVVGPGRIWQLGIRSGTREEHDFARAHTHLYPHGLEAAPEVAAALRGRPVYITVDIDVCDPAYAPGTGTPEPGGVSSRELFAALRAFRGLEVAGFDVVEVSPPLDASDRTAILGAKLVREAILSFF